MALPQPVEHGAQDHAVLHLIGQIPVAGRPGDIPEQSRAVRVHDGIEGDHDIPLRAGLRACLFSWHLVRS